MEEQVTRFDKAMLIESNSMSSHQTLVSTFLYSWKLYRSAWEIYFYNLTLKTLIHLFSMPTEIS